MELNLSYHKSFATDDECLEVLFQGQYGTLETCPNSRCGREARFQRVKGRKAYQCVHCRHQVYPMKGTVMEGTKVALSIWFQVLKDFVADASGITSTFLKGRYPITQCTAWNMLRKIRANIKEEAGQLNGVVEMDESFLGGVKKLVPGTALKGIGNKLIVFGMVERDGRVRLFHVKSKDAKTLRPIIDKHIAKGTTVHHDDNSTYGNMEARGFHPRRVPKKGGQYFCGKNGLHNNNIEGTWSRLKHFLRKYCGVSRKYLQSYLNEFCFRQRNRGKWIKENKLDAVLRIAFGAPSMSSLSHLLNPAA